MEHVSLVCPACCAELEADADAKQVTCEYCGTTIPVEAGSRQAHQHAGHEDADEAGDALEKGRMRAVADKEAEEQRRLVAKAQKEMAFKEWEQKQREAELRRREEAMQKQKEQKKMDSAAMKAVAAFFLLFLLLLELAYQGIHTNGSETAEHGEGQVASEVVSTEGGTGDEDVQPSAVEEPVNEEPPVNVVTEEDKTSPDMEGPSVNEMGVQQVSFGETVSTDNYVFTLESAEWADMVLPPDTSGEYGFLVDEPGSTYLLIKGHFTNLRDETYWLNFATVEDVVINNTYRYSARAVAAVEGGSDVSEYAVEPSSTVIVMFPFSIPDALKEQFEHATVEWTLTDGKGSTVAVYSFEI